MVYFPDESGGQQFCYFLTDGPALFLVEAARHSFTGLEPRWIFKVCLATSLGMPGISKGFHAKMSLLSRRKSTSALSYSEESAVPMHTVLSVELLGSMRTSLEPSADLNDPVDFFASGIFSATSSLRAASSLPWRR